MVQEVLFLVQEGYYFFKHLKLFCVPGFGSCSCANVQSRTLLFFPWAIIHGDLVVGSPMEQEVNMGFEGF